MRSRAGTTPGSRTTSVRWQAGDARQRKRSPATHAATGSSPRSSCAPRPYAPATPVRLLPPLGSPQGSIDRVPYEASAAELLNRLREVPDAAESVLLIGHQPAIQRLALGLAGDGVELARLRDKFPTAAMASL